MSEEGNKVVVNNRKNMVLQMFTLRSEKTAVQVHSAGKWGDVSLGPGRTSEISRGFRGGRAERAASAKVVGVPGASSCAGVWRVRGRCGQVLAAWQAGRFFPLGKREPLTAL